MFDDFFDEMRRFQKDMNKRFEKFFKESKFEKFEKGFKVKEPSVSIKEDKDDVIVDIELPGIDKKDIILKVTKNYLEVNAKKKSEFRISKKGFFKAEKSYREFHRVIPLPYEVDESEARADYKTSILRIRVPKLKKKIMKTVKVK